MDICSLLPFLREIYLRSLLSLQYLSSNTTPLRTSLRLTILQLKNVQDICGTRFWRRSKEWRFFCGCLYVRAVRLIMQSQNGLWSKQICECLEEFVWSRTFTPMLMSITHETGLMAQSDEFSVHVEISSPIGCGSRWPNS